MSLAAHFARLEVAPSASMEEIQVAYKTKMRQYAAEGKPVNELQEAHQILSDSSMRTGYRKPEPAQPLALGVTEFGKGPNDESGQQLGNDAGRPAHGFASFQGHRVSMEDKLLLGAPCGSGWHVFGVCDGHGGRRAADFLVEALPDVVKGLPLASSSNAELEEAASAAFASLDRQLLAREKAEAWHDGSTALLAIIGQRRLKLLQVRGLECRPRHGFTCRRH